MYTQRCKPYLIHDKNWVEPATASDAMENGSQAAANGSFGVPVGSEITGKQNCQAGRVIRNDPSARLRGHREWACLGPGGGGRGCPAGGAQLLLSGIPGSTVGGQSCFVLGSHVSF